ncbi:MAG: hypothetical protein KatS3mg035_0178 [Bacteroidia bacterium]|nr:MAG: hypothetical protein KatS3mg035_0178 [Bacteroidia bacterium]
MRDQIQRIKNKRVAVVCNAISFVDDSINIVDALIKKNVHITKIFAPEHGFRNILEAGKYFIDSLDPVTGIPMISLYGKKKKPTSEDLDNVDIVLFDIQDVGCRFYTYLTTMVYVMEVLCRKWKNSYNFR